MSGGPGFWRRNRWGLLTVLPLLALVLALNPDDPREAWATEPRSPVVAGADRSVTFGGATLRLTGLTPFRPTGRDGAPLPLSSQVRAWRATIHVSGYADPEALAGCELQLVDDAGRWFADQPSEFRSTWLNQSPCVPSEDAAEFDLAGHFLLPASARPTGVRLVVRTQLPDYAWLVPD